MGRSGKPGIGYTFFDHARYLDAWFDALDLSRVTIVGHDWGAALGLHWARRHPGRVDAIAFMEAILKPITWDEFPARGRPLFKNFRTPEVGEKCVLDDNQFVEVILPGGTLRTLEPSEMAEYRAPCHQREHRLPSLAWPRQLPIEGEPADVVAAVKAFDTWLASTPALPKLLIRFDPGAMVPDHIAEWCRQHLAGLEIVDGGEGLHYVQEDEPETIADRVRDWRRPVLA
jgi:haloalkane dehalogenase